MLSGDDISADFIFCDYCKGPVAKAVETFCGQVCLDLYKKQHGQTPKELEAQQAAKKKKTGGGQRGGRTSSGQSRGNFNQGWSQNQGGFQKQGGYQNQGGFNNNGGFQNQGFQNQNQGFQNQNQGFQTQNQGFQNQNQGFQNQNQNQGFQNQNQGFQNQNQGFQNQNQGLQNQGGFQNQGGYQNGGQMFGNNQGGQGMGPGMNMGQGYGSNQSMGGGQGMGVGGGSGFDASQGAGNNAGPSGNFQGYGEGYGGQGWGGTDVNANHTGPNPEMGMLAQGGFKPQRNNQPGGFGNNANRADNFSGQNQDRSEFLGAGQKRPAGPEDDRPRRKKRTLYANEYRFLIHADHVRKILGEKGFLMRRILEKVRFFDKDAKIMIFTKNTIGEPIPHEARDRILCIHATVAGLERALEKIIPIVQPQNLGKKVKLELRLAVPKFCCGTIVGNNGEKVKKIKEDLKSYIQTYQIPLPCSEESVIRIQNFHLDELVETALRIWDEISDNKVTKGYYHYDPIIFPPQAFGNTGSFVDTYFYQSEIAAGRLIDTPYSGKQKVPTADSEFEGGQGYTGFDEIELSSAKPVNNAVYDYGTLYSGNFK